MAGVTLMHVVVLFKEKKQQEKIKSLHTGDPLSHWQTTSFGGEVQVEDDPHLSLRALEAFSEVNHTNTDNP